MTDFRVENPTNTSGLAPKDATFITQTTNSTLTNEQALSALVTGVLSSTTTTGVVASTAFTAGSIPYGNGTILTQDNTNFYWDGILKLGAATPEVRLTSSGDSNYTRLTRTDSSGTARLYNKVGKLASAYSLNLNGSSTGYVNFGSCLTDTTNFTLTYWVKSAFNWVVGDYGQVFDAANVAFTDGWSTRFDPASRIVAVGFPTGGGNSSKVVAVSTWTLVAISFYVHASAGTVKASTNGSTWETFISGANTSSVDGKSNNDVWVGTGKGATQQFFGGLIDDMRYYGRELTNQELADLYAGVAVSTTSLQAYWKFDDGTGTGATDSSGNSHTGTLAAGASWSTDYHAVNSGVSADVEVEVLKSQDGTAAGEEGIQTLGWGLGRTNIDYSTSLNVRQSAGGTVMGSFDSSGNLGIGITPSGNGRLQVKSGAATTMFSKVGGTITDFIANAGNTGTGEDDLYSTTLAAAILTNNGDKITATYGGIFVGAALSTQELRLYFGGTKIYDSGALAIGVATNNWTVNVTCIRVSSSVVRCTVALSTDFGTLFPYSTYTEVTGLTLTNTQVLKVTGEAAGAGAVDNQIVAKLGVLEWKSAA